MKTIVLLAALLLPSVCMAQWVSPPNNWLFNPTRQYPASRLYRPYSYRPYYSQRYRGGYRPSGGGMTDLQKMRQTWALEDIADALKYDQLTRPIRVR